MIVIACLNTKGGVGKSTLCCNLAVAARNDPDEKFDRVAILDMDPQHTLALWWKLRGSPDDITVFSDAASARDGVESLRLDGWDAVLIDTPGQFISHLRDAAGAADFVLLPMKPGVFDIHSAKDAITICERANVPYGVVINDAISGEKFASEIRDGLNAQGVPVLDQQVQHRPSYISSAATGKAAAEMQGGHHAKAEISALWHEVKTRLKVDHRSRREASNVEA